MATRRLAVPLAYPKRIAGPRSVTRIDRHSLILIVGLLALAAFAAVLYLSQASAAAELRFRLSGAEAEAQDLWQRNLALRLEIADLERLERVEERATRLGMVDAPSGEPYIACTLPSEGPAVTTRPAGAAEASLNGTREGGVWARVARRLGWGSGETAATLGPVSEANGQ